MQMNKRVFFILCIIIVIISGVNASYAQNKNIKRTIDRNFKETITPVELNNGEMVRYTRKDGNVLTIELLSTSANILYTNKAKIPADESGTDLGDMFRARTMYEFTCEVLVNGWPLEMRRYVGSQECYYEPYVINGVRIWFDGVSDIFVKDGGFLTQNHGPCMPNKKARFVLQDMTQRICPGEIHAWFKDGDERNGNFIYKNNFIDIGRAFNGDDSFMGAYLGGQAHGGLDVCMAQNSLMYAPFDLDTQKDIRANSSKTWPDGSTWIINTGHIIEKYVPDNTPVEGGTVYGRGARRGCWWHTHAHFAFQINEEEILYNIDPWIIFWQHFEDNKKKDGTLRAMMAPLSHSKTGTKIKFKSVSNPEENQCSLLKYYWTFGDGGWSAGPATEYIYVRPGTYPVTLTVDNGTELASFTQHITIEGADIKNPSLVLASGDEPSFRPRPADAMDVYGWPVKFIPHTLEFLARPSRPEPNTRELHVSNPGNEELDSITYGIDYWDNRYFGWLNIQSAGQGNSQVLDIGVNGEGFPPGEYVAIVAIHSKGALNSPQKFRVVMNVPRQPAKSTGVIIDDKNDEFYCTPYFWVGNRFHGWGWPELMEAEGYNHFYLINGQRNKKGEFARFNPDLEAGIYEVWLYEKTPFASGPPANNEPARFQVRIVHADGDTIVWMQPERMKGFYPRPYLDDKGWGWLERQPTRKIGTFKFKEGKDGFVEILAEGSTGQVIVDAVRFLKMDH
jgi:PKD repeat protein